MLEPILIGPLEPPHEWLLLAKAPTPKAKSDDDQLLCPICLDFPEALLMLTCGHTYCRACIARHTVTCDAHCVCCPYCMQPISEEDKTELGVTHRVTHPPAEARGLDQMVLPLPPRPHRSSFLARTLSQLRCDARRPPPEQDLEDILLQDLGWC